MKSLTVEKKACSSVPTADGTFLLYVYGDSRDGGEHLALIKGAVAGRENVLVRVHSECFTGDVLHSRRCDCGSQLHIALRMIGNAEAGVLIYLRQEGRGIGLVNKLHAYNLQDMGYDTVDANVLLGYQPDERDYSIAALIVKDLDIRSVRMLTNNPAKISGLRRCGVTVSSREPVLGALCPENTAYLRTKIDRMHHIMKLENEAVRDITNTAADNARPSDRPFVTLSYAQSIDGCLAASPGKRMTISDKASLAFVHRLRASHDAILVGIGTVMADNPQLTVRYARGTNPRPVIVDTHLRIPEQSFLVHTHPVSPVVVAGIDADRSKEERLVRHGVTVLRVPLDEQGHIRLDMLLAMLRGQGIRRIMVEGGARIISSFISQRLVDRLVVTIAPFMIGGIPAFSRASVVHALPALENVTYQTMGRDIVMQGDPEWPAR